MIIKLSMYYVLWSYGLDQTGSDQISPIQIQSFLACIRLTHNLRSAMASLLADDNVKARVHNQ